MLHKINLNVYAYNASNFDNHFILKAIRDIHPNDWYNYVEIIGDVNQMKILSYNYINFLDLCLMLGGSSLKNLCKDVL